MQWNARVAALAALIGYRCGCGSSGARPGGSLRGFLGLEIPVSSRIIVAWTVSPMTQINRSLSPSRPRQPIRCTTGIRSRWTAQGSITRRPVRAIPTSSASSSGPGRSARAMAIVHIAMFDAVNSISPSLIRVSRAFPTSLNSRRWTRRSRRPHTTRSWSSILHSAPTAIGLLDENLAAIPTGTRRPTVSTPGAKGGTRRHLTAAAQDGSNHPEPRSRSNSHVHPAWASGGPIRSAATSRSRSAPIGGRCGR